MRAARTTSYGPPDLLCVEEVDDLRPGAGEVVVDIAAAAVNYPDLLIMSGGYQVSWPLPLVPGSEFAGTVRAVGTGVTGPRIGDRVAGTTAVGAFAEQIAVAADALWPVPDGADLTEAAALRVTYLTAYHALRSVAAARPGDWVVVLGAAGGVGLAALDIAKLLGARVIAVASGAARSTWCCSRVCWCAGWRSAPSASTGPTTPGATRRRCAITSAPAGCAPTSAPGSGWTRWYRRCGRWASAARSAKS